MKTRGSEGGETKGSIRTEFSPSRRALLGVIGGSALLALLYIAQAPTDLHPQLAISAILVATFLALRFWSDRSWGRLAFLFLGAFISARYIFWRAFYSLDSLGIVSTVASLVLFGAEVYGVIIFLLGIFVNITPLNRRIYPLTGPAEAWPTVDVFIPTYNESIEIVRATLLSAMQIDYPKEKLKIYLLDDGATETKRNDKDLAKRAQAAARGKELRELCDSVGARYSSRRTNEHAKAGNINAALKETSGELLLILDADHIPTHDILRNTVGQFQRNSKLWLVQTPHFFANPDPLERNLDTFARMPSESEMFYSIIHRGLDFWNASFFCGSAGVISRKALEQIGGFSCQTVTEDAETSIQLHGLGYESAYVARPMISGLAPESFASFVTQRVRWAQGMAQIFILKNPFLVPGLKIEQRLAYFSSSFFWFFPCARLVFLLAPVAYLVFGLHVYNAGPWQVLAYTVPHLIATLAVSDFLFGKVRWAFISELYEIMQSFFCLEPILRVIQNPFSPVFKVTPKGETLDEDFISPLARPFYIFISLTLAAMGAGVIRLFILPIRHENYAVVLTLAWTVFNFVILLAAFGALFERRQRRASARLPADYDVEMAGQGEVLNGRVYDLSEGGASLLFNTAVTHQVGDSATLRVLAPGRNTSFEFTVKVRNRRPWGDQTLVGIQFLHLSLEEISQKIALVFGQSERWVQFQRCRESRIGIFRSTVFLLTLGLKGMSEQLVKHKTSFLTRLRFRPRPQAPLFRPTLLPPGSDPTEGGALSIDQPLPI